MTAAQLAAELLRLERMKQALPSGFTWSALPAHGYRTKGGFVGYGF